jgi:endonuclease/exonuclease/phosphatase family metal-dependent hydrolase
MRRTAQAALSLFAVIGSGCTPGINYASVEGPRYAGGPLMVPAAASADRGGLRLVTFNVKYGEQVDSAIAVLARTPELREADVVALQEVDAAATERIAGALDMRWVYYPATLHPKFNRDFGNAVLSRWPIVADRKLILPHLGRFRRTARTATAATILVSGRPLRVYSAHLGTMAEIGPGAKREQAQVIMADAAAYGRVAVLGDMNSYGVGHAFEAAGFAWATERNPRTFAVGRWDHIFLKGVTLAHDSATGVIQENRGASDHRPVWAVIASPALN